MTAARIVFTGIASFAFVGTLAAADAKKVTYEDDVLPIFRDNCLKCHNPDKLKGDLDLSTFNGTIKGGAGGVSVNAGDPDGSKLYKSITHAEEPEMPPKTKMPDKEIATIRKWIESGLLQGVNSKALTGNKPTVDLTLKKVSVGKPEGPPPMPGPLALDPFVKVTRGTALNALASSPWAPVVALSGAKQIVLYNTSDLEFLGVLPFPEGFPCDLKFSRNGKLLLAGGGRGGQSGLVAVWDIAKGERVMTVGDQFDSVLAADISSDQKWIALGGPDRVLKIYDTKDGSLEHRIKKHTEWITAMEFSPDSKYLATGDRNGGVVLWEADSGQEMFTLAGHKGGITSISWRGDSEIFISASEDGTIKVWKASDGSSVKSVSAHSGGVLCARYTHDGRVVSCGRDNKVQIWSPTGSAQTPPAFTGELPNRVTFSDDGKKVIGSDWNGRVFVWDATSGKALGELDANPPTLVERVQQGAQRIADLQAAADKAAAAFATADAEAKIAQGNLDKAKSSLATAQAGVPAKEKEANTLKDQLAKNAGDEALKKQQAEVRDAIKNFKAQINTLPKEITAATKLAEAATKKAADAKSVVDEAMSRLTAAKTSLAKWKAVQQNAQAKPAGKVATR